jgi:hypothetical protein
MPLKKLQLKSGVNREGTRYSTEGGWFSCDKIRFRQGTPEKIGGWQRISSETYNGVCRALWQWATLSGVPYLGVGTNTKYYIAYGGAYYDITPVVSTVTLTNPFTTVSGSATVTVTDVAHGATTGTFVTFSGATAVGGLTLNGEYQITVLTVDSYTITAASNASSPATGGGTVTAAYQVSAGTEIAVALSGWGAGPWGLGAWGIGSPGAASIRIWNHQNFGQDLIYGPKGGAMYYWDATTGLTSRGVALTSLSGATDVPTVQTLFMVSDASRFTIAFGCNDYGSSDIDPMLIRWSDQESAVNWTPAATNQAGSLRLSHGSRIDATLQTRQEILVWTDTSVYGLQYLGPPVVWGSQLLADNVSIVSDRAVALAAGVAYWMGEDKFYTYDGRVNTLSCDLRQYIFSDINLDQYSQVCAGTNEQFNEVWWFYCSASSTQIDRYAVYNYLEKVWYYGNLGRTAWTDIGVTSNFPIAATYVNNLVQHETGNDDNATASTLPIEAYITSSEFDIDDGDRFGFVWRVLPDVTFRGSSTASPSATMTLLPLQNSGSGYNNPASLGGSDNGVVTRTATVPIEAFTGQVNIRVRGRQMSIKMASDGLGVQWQLGAPRLDIRPDGRRGS